MSKVRVSSRPERFRRAGMDFTREPVEVDVDDRTIEALEGEKMLAVERVKEAKGQNNKDKDAKEK